MATSRWTPSKGREIDDITDKLNELLNKLSAPTVAEGGTKSYQDIVVVKKADGTHAIQFRTKDGIVESDSTAATGFKLL